jgi:hypothetical protein
MVGTPFRVAAAASVVALALVLVLPSAGSNARRVSASPIDDLVASCPSAADIAAINARLNIVFEADPSSTQACGMSLLQANTYRVLLVMQHLQFARPLPWTSAQLYDWFTGAISAIRFRGDIQYSFCCDPANTIDIAANNLVAAHATKWFDQQGSLSGLLELFVHEARHNQNRPHTCDSGTDDQTWDELGGWGAEYALDLWIGLYGDSFLDAQAPLPASTYRDAGDESVQSNMFRFCGLASSDISSTSTAAPASVQQGSTFTVTTTVSNPGGASEHVWVAEPVPAGTELVSSAASAGSCMTVQPVRVSCDLGAMAAGATATVTLQLRATGDVGSTITTVRHGYWPLGPLVIATVHDPNTANNESGWTVNVTAPPKPAPKPGPKPKPHKKPPPKCKPRQHSTKKHPCRRR